jgi:hypothetical protein
LSDFCYGRAGIVGCKKSGGDMPGAMLLSFGYGNAGKHMSGDYGIVYDMYDYLSGTYEGSDAAEIGVSVQNHMIGFAAEESRLTETIVNIDEFCKKRGLEV